MPGSGGLKGVLFINHANICSRLQRCNLCLVHDAISGPVALTRIADSSWGGFYEAH